MQRLAATSRSGHADGSDRLTRYFQDLSFGRDRRPGAPKRLLDHSAWGVCRPDGRLGLRQDHAHEHPRLPGPTDRRAALARGSGGGAVVCRRAGIAANAQDRLRVPDLQPARAHQRPRKRDVTALVFGRALVRRKGPPAGPGALGADGPCGSASPRARAALRRPATAGRHRARPDQPPGAALGR